MTTLSPVQLNSDALLALHAAHPARYPVLLQSVAQGASLGRFDILFACPEASLKLNANGSLTCAGNIKPGNTFLGTLDNWWRQDKREQRECDLPFVGGWFLYLGYELAAEIEPTLNLVREHTVAQAIRIPAAVIVRHSDGAAWIVDESARHAATIQSDIDGITSITERTGPLLSAALLEEPDEHYLDAVAKALEYIAAGDIYQANLSRRWKGALRADAKPHDVFHRLRLANPSPFAALAVLEDIAIASSSPERLVEVRNRNVSTRPIAGTRPRQVDHSDDAVRLKELHTHPKERAEHVMLIDLERNDLGRVCEAGSVVVDEFMSLESYAHVHHIVSNIRGRLRANVTPGQAIAAVFPGGTITGCPKVRCMQIIAELERAERGAYTGSLGYLNRDGSMDLNILIRSIEMRGRDIYFRAGAGIVADSIADRELDETRAKALGLIRALET